MKHEILSRIFGPTLNFCSKLEHLTPKLVLESYDPIKVGKVREKLEEFAVPDENERKAWLESLRKQMTK